MKRGKWTIRMALALVLGSLATVAVAWYAECAAWLPRMVLAPGAVWPIPVPKDWPAVPDYGRAGSTSLLELQWCFAEGGPDRARAMLVSKSGWPCLAMRYFRINTPAGPQAPAFNETTDGLRLRAEKLRLSETWFRQGDSTILPLIPIPLGFALDAVAYGAVAMLLIQLPAIHRYARRRAQGACLACGYDRRGLPSAAAACPECGTIPAAKPI